MSTPPARELSPAPPAALALRFVAGFGLLALGPVVFWDTLQRAGVVAVSPTFAENQEGSMLAWLLTAACVLAFALWQRPAQAWRPLALGHVASRYAVFVVGWVALLVAYLTVVRIVPQPGLEYLAAGPAGRPGFWVVVAGVTIAAPVAEEIVFRGYLQGALQPAMGARWAVALTATVFGLVHTMPYALPVGLLGAFFGWLAVRHGSLLAPIAAHTLHNGVVVAVTVLWPDSLDWLYRR
jgi:membrane protease YdiL (CAAX protease family)